MAVGLAALPGKVRLSGHPRRPLSRSRPRQRGRASHWHLRTASPGQLTQIGIERFRACTPSTRERGEPGGDFHSGARHDPGRTQPRGAEREWRSFPSGGAGNRSDPGPAPELHIRAPGRLEISTHARPAGPVRSRTRASRAPGRAHPSAPDSCPLDELTCSATSGVRQHGERRGR